MSEQRVRAVTLLQRNHGVERDHFAVGVGGIEMIQIAGVVSKRCVRLGHYPKGSSKKIKVIDVLGAKIKLQSPVQCIQTDALSLCFGTINHGVQLRNIGLV